MVFSFAVEPNSIIVVVSLGLQVLGWIDTYTGQDEGWESPTWTWVLMSHLTSCIYMLITLHVNIIRYTAKMVKLSIDFCSDKNVHVFWECNIGINYKDSKHVYKNESVVKKLYKARRGCVWLYYTYYYIKVSQLTSLFSEWTALYMLQFKLALAATSLQCACCVPVSLALPPVGCAKTSEQEPHMTTVWACENTVVIWKHPISYVMLDTFQNWAA